MTRLCVVGSDRFPIDAVIGGQVVDEIRAAKPEVILTRGGPHFDQFVTKVAALLGIPVILFPARGGSDNWERDVELAGQADQVMAFLAPDSLSVEKMSGTQHVIEKAMDQRKPVRAYTTVDQRLVWAGELP